MLGNFGVNQCLSCIDRVLDDPVELLLAGKTAHHPTEEQVDLPSEQGEFLDQLALFRGDWGGHLCVWIELAVLDSFTDFVRDGKELLAVSS